VGDDRLARRWREIRIRNIDEVDEFGVVSEAERKISASDDSQNVVLQTIVRHGVTEGPEFGPLNLCRGVPLRRVVLLTSFKMASKLRGGAIFTVSGMQPIVAAVIANQIGESFPRRDGFPKFIPAIRGFLVLPGEGEGAKQDVLVHVSQTLESDVFTLQDARHISTFSGLSLSTFQNTFFLSLLLMESGAFAMTRGGVV
jgi:hypothetical protein